MNLLAVLLGGRLPLTLSTAKVVQPCQSALDEAFAKRR